MGKKMLRNWIGKSNENRTKFNRDRYNQLRMKEILNRLINQETISKREANEVLKNISKDTYNPSQIASFLTVYMMRSISVEETGRISGGLAGNVPACGSGRFQCY